MVLLMLVVTEVVMSVVVIHRDGFGLHRTLNLFVNVTAESEEKRERSGREGGSGGGWFIAIVVVCAHVWGHKRTCVCVCVKE